VRLKIPKRFEQPLSDLIQLPRDTRQQLVEAVRTERGSREPNELAAVASPTTSLDEERMSEIIQMLVSLYVVKENSSLAEVVDDICIAAESSGNEQLRPQDGDWPAFKEDLTALLSADDSLGAIAKAQYLEREHPYVFCTARAVTDIRPVFKQVLRETPAGMLVHTLKITYHEGDHADTKDFFVALDPRKLKELRRILDRAVEKENALKEFMSSSGMEQLQRESE